MPHKFIRAYTQTPKELFRLNNGRAVRLRSSPAFFKPLGAVDLFTVEGKARPLALNPASYEWPNGASMRVNSQTLHYKVRNYMRPSAFIFSVPAGIELPDDLILVHEFRDHYSLQARREMAVSELDATITNFLSTQGECLTKEMWTKRYPRPTERW